MAFIGKRTIRGKSYYRILESYREAGKVRKRVLCELGRHPSLKAAHEYAIKQGFGDVLSGGVVSSGINKKMREQVPSSLVGTVTRAIVEKCSGVDLDLAGRLIPPDADVEFLDCLLAYLKAWDREKEMRVDPTSRDGALSLDCLVAEMKRLKWILNLQSPEECLNEIEGLIRRWGYYERQDEPWGCERMEKKIIDVLGKLIDLAGNKEARELLKEKFGDKNYQWFSESISGIMAEKRKLKG